MSRPINEYGDNSYCIKQPNNMGIMCIEHDKCEKCGWNPEYIKKLREKNKKQRGE